MEDFSEVSIMEYLQKFYPHKIGFVGDVGAADTNCRLRCMVLFVTDIGGNASFVERR